MTCVLFEIISNCLDCLMEKLKSAQHLVENHPQRTVMGTITRTEVYQHIAEIRNMPFSMDFTQNCPL